MHNKDRYSEAVERINNSLVNYRMILKHDVPQPAALEKLKSNLVADKVILGEIYEEASAAHRKEKLTYSQHYDHKYMKFRSNGKAVKDAEAMARMFFVEPKEEDLNKDPLPSLERVNRAKSRMDGSRRLRDDLNDVIIDIAVKLKNIKIDSRY